MTEREREELRPAARPSWCPPCLGPSREPENQTGKSMTSSLIAVVDMTKASMVADVTSKILDFN